MKRKIAFIALAMLMTASSLFAASSFGGKARLRLGVQQPDGTDSGVTFGFKDATNATFAFYLLESNKEAAGKGSIYGEVSAIAQVRIKRYEDSRVDYNWRPLGDNNVNDIFQNYLRFRLGLNYANLVFDADKNIKLGINGMSPVQRYARGWEVEIDNGNTIGTTPFMTYSTAFKNNDYDQMGYLRAHGGWIPGLTFTYGKAALSFSLNGGYSFGESTTGNNPTTRNTNPDYLVLLQGNDLVVADGLKLSADAGVFHGSQFIVPGFNADGDGNPIAAITDDQTHIIYGAKVDYQKDDISFLLGASGNVKVKGDLPFTDVNEDNAIEASLNFAYNGDIKASVDAWFLDNQALWSNDDEPDAVTYHNRAKLGFVYRDQTGEFLANNNIHLHKALSIRANVKPIDAFGFTLRAQDILNQGILGIDLPIGITDRFTLTPSFEYTLATNKTYADGSWSLGNEDANNIIEGQLAVNYKHDLFSLYCYLRAGAEPNAPVGYSKGMYFIPYLDLKSGKLVDGATFTLRWQKGCFNVDGYESASKSGMYHSGSGFGEIYLEARIDF